MAVWSSENHGIWLIPEVDGETFVYPPTQEWPQIFQVNRARTKKLAEIRWALRGRVLAEAISYTQEILGDEAVAQSFVGSDPEKQPLLVSGHQPRFYHPGVWYKNFLLKKAAHEVGGIPINLIVDTDEVGAMEVRLPKLEGGWGVIKANLCTAAPGETFETMPIPSLAQREAFVEALRAVPTQGYDQSTKKALEGFVLILEELQKVEFNPAVGLAGWSTVLRRRYEGRFASYLELPVSRIARMPEFKDFAEEIIADAEGFSAQYNRTLQEYRKEHGYRYKVNPFPDLHRNEAEKTFELPFWTVKDGTRYPATVVSDGEGTKLRTGGALRPRGMSLTLFMRLFCADIFIHGIGGAKYDGSTSRFIQEYYGLEPPVYAGATLTMYPKLEVSQVGQAEVAALEELIRDVEYNPDRHLADAGLSPGEEARLQGLVQRKQELIQKIKTPGADRKALGAEIKEVNLQIGLGLDGYLDSLRERLYQRQRLLTEKELVQARDFPYFLFDPEEMP